MLKTMYHDFNKNIKQHNYFNIANAQNQHIQIILK